ncbi:MAG: MoaD/ThiS family protein [Anaerolineales bacterium]|nr:MoaD/ThiS family protein [Anaerolineales bacterium]
MRVEVHLHTTLARQTPEGYVSCVDMEIAEGSMLGDLLKQMGFEIDDDHTLLVINGRLAEREQALGEGDVVHLIPALSGGGD